LMAESLSTSWQSDVFRAALSDIPVAKRDALMPEYSALDTPVVGSDNVKVKARAAKASLAPISSELLKIAARDEELKKSSLERVGLYAEGLAASNNWVVSGKRTASGKPLLANDPHLAVSVPSIWYLVHLSAPGIRAAGVSIPGINGVIIGHNDKIAWGMTNLGPDVQDLYKEKFDAANPNRYMTPQGWKDAEIRKEEIKVRKTATNPETEIVNLDVTITRHGPIVVDKNGERLALRWTVLNSNLESVSMFYKLNRAKNWEDFTEALKTYAGATQNFIYADQEGHIGYYGAGVIPIRKSGDGSVPYDGSKDDGEWIGTIPFEKLPHVYDPPSGMIVTANARIVGKDYPYFLTHGWSAPYRQKRITDLLSAKPKLTIEDFRAVQGDTYAIGGKKFANAVVRIFGNTATDENLKASLKLLSEWDGHVEPDSKAALLVHEMRDIFGVKIGTAIMGAERVKQYRTPLRNTMMDNVVKSWSKEFLPKEFKNWTDFLKACHDEAREIISKKLGADESKWTFGNSVQVRFSHPLSVAPMIGAQFKIDPIPQHGNGYSGGLGPTPNVGPGVSMRLIADPSNWDNSQHGITLGESGDPKSAHFKDQLNDWINATPHVFPFSKEAVNKAAKQKMVLMPR
jgi:penicillin G amidase